MSVGMVDPVVDDVIVLTVLNIPRISKLWSNTGDGIDQNCGQKDLPSGI